MRRAIRRTPPREGQRGSILAGALMMMTLLVGTSMALLYAAAIENSRVKRAENHVAARLRAEGAVYEGIQAVKQFYEDAALNKTNIWELVGDTSPGYVVAEEQTSYYMGSGTTFRAYVDKRQEGGYEEFVNYIEADCTVGPRTVHLKMPTWNMKLGEYSMWAHGSDEYDSADVNRGTRSGAVTFTPGDYSIGHVYTADGFNIMAGAPRATFHRRAESAGDITNEGNGDFLMDGQPREFIDPYSLDYKAGFWSNARDRALETGGLKLPGNYDYIIDLDQISAALDAGNTSITIKRRRHRSDSSPSIDGDATLMTSMTGKNTITQLPIWDPATNGEWQDNDWMVYWDSVTVPLPTLDDWTGVIFAGDVNAQGSVSQSSYLSTVLLKGTAQFKSVSVVATDDMFFVDNVYGGTTNGDFSREPGNWDAGSGEPCTVAAIAKDEFEWSIVNPRVSETMCGMFSQYGRFYTETKDYATQLFRMPSVTEWDFDFDFQIDADSSLWNGNFRERDAKNMSEQGRGVRTDSMLGRSWSKDWFVECPWTQRTGGPWVGAGGYDNSTYWHYPCYVGDGAFNSLSYDVDSNLANPLFQPPLMPIIMNGFELGGMVEPAPQALDTWT